MSRSILVAAILLSACASAPKPRELEALEQLRASPSLEAAQKRAPDLVEQSNKLFNKAHQEWQSKDLEESRRDALMGHIKLDTAYALTEQDQARAKIIEISHQLVQNNDDLLRAEKDLVVAREQVALLKRLAETKSSADAAALKAIEEKQAMEKKLREEQDRTQAQQKVSQAELALKTADTVDAIHNAKVEYGAAMDLVTRAQNEFKAASYAAAGTSAEMAKQKAEQAFAAAKPIFSEVEKNKDLQSRNDALSKDAASIPGVSVRLERRGEVQRLVIPLPNLFVRKQTTVEPSAGATLDQVARLIRKYPGYPVQVIGYTDKVGRPTELVALSLARAQSVQSALLVRGVEASRMMVSGQGANEPVNDNRTATGRKQNNRVEVSFLFQ